MLKIPWSDKKLNVLKEAKAQAYQKEAVIIYWPHSEREKQICDGVKHMSANELMHFVCYRYVRPVTKALLIVTIDNNQIIIVTIFITK